MLQDFQNGTLTRKQPIQFEDDDMAKKKWKVISASNIQQEFRIVRKIKLQTLFLSKY